MKIENQVFVQRAEEIISLADKAIQTRRGDGHLQWVNIGLFTEFRVTTLSFLKIIYGVDHPFYTEFNRQVNTSQLDKIEIGKAIVKSVKDEIEGGWLNSVKGIVTAEVFSDFLEMADYLLSENYKDAAAVMIGSVLEEHLRQLCSKNEISIDFESDGKMKPKKADVLNADLAKKEVYNKLDQKNVTAWLDLRNKAAHGRYDEYNKEQVESMYRGVLEFMTRNSL